MKFATALVLKAWPARKIPLPCTDIESSQSSSGRAREIWSITRTGPRWFCLS